MKYVRELLITVLLIGAGFFAVRWIQERDQATRAAARIQELERNYDRQGQALDSVIQLKNQAMRAALMALGEKARTEAAFTELTLRNENLIEKHERLRKVLRTVLPDTAIVREWAKLYR